MYSLKEGINRNSLLIELWFIKKDTNNVLKQKKRLRISHRTQRNVSYDYLLIIAIGSLKAIRPTDNSVESAAIPKLNKNNNKIGTIPTTNIGI